MEVYHKIHAPFKRHLEGPNKGRLIEGDWSKPEFEYLANNIFEFTEKVDGTNIRIGWDYQRYTVEFGGRTDRAIIPDPLLFYLETKFTPYKFEKSGLNQAPVTLFGEGYGPNIQGGGKYRDDHSFVLFDVKIGPWWLDRENVNDIATKLGIDAVPVIGHGTLWDGIDMVSEHYENYQKMPPLRSTWGDFEAEGIVARPVVPLFNRKGERIICKIKARDFR